MNLYRTLLITLPLSVIMQSCWQPYELPSQKDSAYAPIYVDPNEAQEITFEDPRNLGNPGKIYYKDGYLFVTEWFEGIHVFDDTDPTNPIPLTFIKVSGVTDVAISGNKMYVNNLQDLVTLDLSDPTNPTIAQVNKGMFEHSELNYPPDFNTYFECVDAEKGQVVGWEKVTYTDQKCFR